MGLNHLIKSHGNNLPLFIGKNEYCFGLLAIFLLFVFPAFSQHSIIPTPVSYSASGENFPLEKNIDIRHFFNKSYSQDPTLTLSINILKNTLKKEGIITSDGSKQKINLYLLKKTDDKIGREGYHLEVCKNKIDIKANTPSGIFYGVQTLKQLIETHKENIIKGCKIIDYPRFQWRGLMLDVSRHFFTVDEVKAFIELMSEYKYNTFHWHLTDDNGWRIEIKSLPKLTEVGAWRVVRHGKFGSSRKDPIPGEPTTYGGYYTQEQIKEVVSYARDRNITILPEIDIPGHSMAALAAYPELSTRKEPKSVNPGTKFARWFTGGFEMLIENTLNPADEKVYEFVDKVMTEVADLFPGEYIHMGGDEAYHGYWEDSEECQRFMKKNHIANTHDLQAYFVHRVEKIIRNKGKKMIGWDEILEGGALNQSAAVMSWRGMKGGIEAVKKGHKVVMSPTTYAYLDYMQGDETVENKIYAKLNLKKSYEFDPAPDSLDATYIMGGQANMWTEAVPTYPFVQYMVYPRAFAIAESVWSPKENKNWADFFRRTEVHFDLFDRKGHNICKAEYEPIINVYMEGDKLMCTLTNNIPNTTIYYTVNNTYPPRFGTIYRGPFEVPQGDLRLRTQTFYNGKPVGRELIVHRDDLLKRIK